MNIDNLIKEIEKGVAEANKYFVENNINAKAYSPINVEVKTKTP